MAVQLKAILTARNKEVEQQVIEAARHQPVAVAGGRAKPRELDFQLRSVKDAINTRMRLYNLSKKQGFDLTVKIAGIAYR